MSTAVLRCGRNPMHYERNLCRVRMWSVPKSHKSAVTQPYLFMKINWITQDEADLERNITCTGVRGGNGAKAKKETKGEKSPKEIIPTASEKKSVKIALSVVADLFGKLSKYRCDKHLRPND